jgi:hypothetical protein
VFFFSPRLVSPLRACLLWLPSALTFWDSRFWAMASARDQFRALLLADLSAALLRSQASPFPASPSAASLSSIPFPTSPFPASSFPTSPSRSNLFPSHVSTVQTLPCLYSSHTTGLYNLQSIPFHFNRFDIISLQPGRTITPYRDWLTAGLNDDGRFRFQSWS